MAVHGDDYVSIGAELRRRPGMAGAMDGIHESGGVRDLGVGRSLLTVRLARAAAAEGTA
jgi:hypothetical protein